MFKKIVAFIVVSSVGAFVYGQHLANTVPDNEVQEFKIMKVLDGDTVKINYYGVPRSVRIVGIDAPESYTIRKGYVECYGVEASEFAKEYFSGATTVFIKKDALSANVDQYNRLLRHIYRTKEENFSEVAIKKGFAFYLKEFKVENAGSLIEAESEAKRNNLGVWKNCEGKAIPAKN